MYEDQGNYRVGINWKDIIIKLILLILFLVLLMWMMPKPQLDTFYDRIFNENIQTMKEAARNYYTVDRLPINVGESTSMTLQEMQDSKLVLPFVDKDNNTCNMTNSFVQVTKTGENEYALKVQLSCGDQTDYILDTIGCYDVCPSGECEVPEEEPDKEVNDTPSINTPVQKVTEYQFKKAITNSNTTYSCPVGYTRNGKECYKIVDVDRINAEMQYGKDTEIITNAIPVSSGGGVEYATPQKTIVGTDYTCPAGYESNGSYCYLYTAGTIIEGEDSYSCPAGYTEYGSTCYKVTSGTRVEATATCPSGYSESSDGRCYKKTSPTVTSGSKTCPSGYSPNGSNCVKVTDATKSYSSSWVQKATNTYTYKVSQYETASEKRVLTNSVYKKTCTTCYTYSWYYTYVTYYKPVTYTCSTGTKNGTKCYSYANYNTTAGSKVCSVGTLQSDGYCYQYTSKVTSGSSTVICPTNYEYNSADGKCYRYTNKVHNSEPDRVVCPTGYREGSNGKCYKKTGAELEYKYRYTCPSGYTQAGSGENTTCYKVTAPNVTYICNDKDAVLNGTKCIKTVKGSELGYTCPSGYFIRDEKYCVKTERQTTKIIEKTTTTTSYKYTWSKSKTLDGWTFTGKTREVNA